MERAVSVAAALPVLGVEARVSGKCRHVQPSARIATAAGCPSRQRRSVLHQRHSGLTQQSRSTLSSSPVERGPPDPRSMYLRCAQVLNARGAIGALEEAGRDSFRGRLRRISRQAGERLTRQPLALCEPDTTRHPQRLRHGACHQMICRTAERPQASVFVNPIRKRCPRKGAVPSHSLMMRRYSLACCRHELLWTHYCNAQLGKPLAGTQYSARLPAGSPVHGDEHIAPSASLKHDLHVVPLRLGPGARREDCAFDRLPHGLLVATVVRDALELTISLRCPYLVSSRTRLPIGGHRHHVQHRASRSPGLYLVERIARLACVDRIRIDHDFCPAPAFRVIPHECRHSRPLPLSALTQTAPTPSASSTG